MSEIRSRWPASVFLILVLSLALGACASSGGDSLDYVEVDVAYFHDELAGHGEWLEVEDFGWAWAPHGVWVDWRPYSYGCWVDTAYGFTWHSYWDWGSICFHYGRWWDHPRWGWVWVPDRTWGPAWVAFIDGPDCYGWAPLPPQCRWRRDRGIRGDPVWRRHIPDRAWCFVPRSHFDDEDLRPRILPSARNPDLVGRGRDVTDYRLDRDHVVNRSLDRDRVQSEIGRPVPRREVVFGDRPTAGATRPDARRIEAYRPDTSRPARTSTRDLPTRIGAAPARAIPDRDRLERELQQRRESERLRLEGLRREASVPEAPRTTMTERIRREQEAMKEETERDRRTIEAWSARDRQPDPRVTRSAAPRYEPTPRPTPVRRAVVPESRGAAAPKAAPAPVRPSPAATPNRRNTPSRSVMPSRVPAPSRAEPARTPEGRVMPARPVNRR